MLHDPKVDIVIDDGRRWLNPPPDERFDVIVMNTTWHWRAHITDLLSTEFMGSCARTSRRAGSSTSTRRPRTT